jgi:uncharacterized protein (DUF2336 family)
MSIRNLIRTAALSRRLDEQKQRLAQVQRTLQEAAESLGEIADQLEPRSAHQTSIQEIENGYWV